MEAKQKNLQTMQRAAPDLEGKSERIRQQIVTINQQRAHLAVDYKDSVRVRVTYYIHTCMQWWLVRQSWNLVMYKGTCSRTYKTVGSLLFAQTSVSDECKPASRGKHQNCMPQVVWVASLLAPVCLCSFLKIFFSKRETAHRRLTYLYASYIVYQTLNLQ